ncbi:hypothetical protein NBRC10512_000787 [Rhodotorula toruloides]|uniref:RHTO0S06e08878g1_1 n=2 Tax=Rhodotorula toruloides TaxID=5286 RepID=A0A061B321_RHOTO|nr:uncharacterized protein RHTO_06381 [Rhodotorula toruloides NP11]EMS24377.1 hypothetical protein RHTO_06381 [Rhodotorula toruloides NP11]CDR42022.1 RHTO0S06e08878g1_1 [Rhodotorula toruloides]
MGLSYFAQTCSTEATTKAAQLWCVAKEGTCCGVCPNTLASLGTRVGLTSTIFFATAVVVVDGAEAPFIFLTTTLQALAYIITILQAGFAGDGISRFHAYYALLCALGFICPLSAASVTATHYLYGGSHQKSGVRLLAFRTNIQHPHQHQNSLSKTSHRGFTDSPTVLRSFGSPFFSSTASGSRYRQYEPAARPLITANVWNRDASSTDNSPVLRADEGERRDRFGETTLQPSSRRSSRTRDEEAEIESRPLDRLIPASFLSTPPLVSSSPKDAETERIPSPIEHHSPRHHPLADEEIEHHSPHHGPSSPAPSSPGHRSPKHKELDSPSSPHSTQNSPHHDPHSPHHPSPRPSPRSPHDSTTALPPLPPSALDAGLRQRAHHPQRSSRPVEQADDPSSSDDSSASSVAGYTDEQRKKIANKTAKGWWRRYGMLGSNAALFILWLVTLLYVHGIVGSFKLTQTNCPDPTGTSLLSISTIVAIGLSLVVFVVTCANFYSHWVHYHLRRIFDYSRDGNRWTRMVVPAIFSGTVFATWLSLLWSSYELAAQPSSSLLAGTEQMTTFPTILSITLTVKPVCDLVKAMWKHHRRSENEAKERKKMEAQATREQESRQSRRRLVDSEKEETPHTSSRHGHRSADHPDRPSPPERVGTDFSTTTSMRPSVSVSPASTFEPPDRRPRRKRESMRRAVFGRSLRSAGDGQ